VLGVSWSSWAVEIAATRLALLPRRVAEAILAAHDVRPAIESVLIRHPLARLALEYSVPNAMREFRRRPDARRETATLARTLVRMACRATPAGFAASVGPAATGPWAFPNECDPSQRSARVRVAPHVIAELLRRVDSELSDEDIVLLPNPALTRAAGRYFTLDGSPVYSVGGEQTASVNAGRAAQVVFDMIPASGTPMRRAIDDVAERTDTPRAEVAQLIAHLVRHGFLLTNQHPDLLADLLADALARLPAGRHAERESLLAQQRAAESLERQIRDGPALVPAFSVERERVNVDLIHDGPALRVPESARARIAAYANLVVQRARRMSSPALREAFKARYEGVTEVVPLLTLLSHLATLQDTRESTDAAAQPERAIVNSAVAHCLRHGSLEYRISAQELAPVLAEPSYGPTESFELGVRIIAPSVEALRLDRYVIAPAVFFGAMDRFGSIARFAYALSGRIPGFDTCGADAYEIVAEPAGAQHWVLANRSPFGARAAIRQFPLTDHPDDLTVRDLYVRMGTAERLELCRADGTPLKANSTNMLATQNISNVMRIVASIAYDGRIAPQPFFPPDKTRPFTPRIVHDDAVLTPAYWIVPKATANDPERFHAFRERYLVPDRILLGYLDRQLFVDLGSALGREFFEREVARAHDRELTLTEALDVTMTARACRSRTKWSWRSRRRPARRRSHATVCRSTGTSRSATTPATGSTFDSISPRSRTTRYASRSSRAWCVSSVGKRTHHGISCGTPIRKRTSAFATGVADGRARSRPMRSRCWTGSCGRATSIDGSSTSSSRRSTATAARQASKTRSASFTRTPRRRCARWESAGRPTAGRSTQRWHLPTWQACAGRCRARRIAAVTNAIAVSRCRPVHELRSAHWIRPAMHRSNREPTRSASNARGLPAIIARCCTCTATAGDSPLTASAKRPISCGR
jgi:hypothetical protein